eukprot:SAG22_NODE_4693_length_1190_cov_4.004583_1_plen_154_part_00
MSFCCASTAIVSETVRFLSLPSVRPSVCPCKSLLGLFDREFEAVCAGKSAAARGPKGANGSDGGASKPRKITSFLENDLVFVRLRGQPWWPARVCKDAAGEWVTKVKEASKYHVLFFGDDTEQYVTADKLEVRLPHSPVQGRQPGAFWPYYQK